MNNHYFNGQRTAMRGGRWGGVFWLHGDHLGSASLTTNDTGGVVGQMRYGPYGTERWGSGAMPSDYRFTDQRSENGVGLLDYDARMYSPLLGRFISPDSIVPNAANSQDLNRYGYVRHNPMGYTDPTGHQSCPLGGGCQNGMFGGAQGAGIVALLITWGAYYAAANPPPFTTPLDVVPAASSNTAGEMPNVQPTQMLANPDQRMTGVGNRESYPSAADGDVGLFVGGPLLSVKPWEVGEHRKLLNKSDPNDCMEIHHCPQKHPAKQAIPGYDEDTAPAIAVPVDKHRGPGGLNSMNITGTYRGTPRQLVSEGLSNLRAVGAPESAIRKLQKMINKKYGPYLKAE